MTIVPIQFFGLGDIIFEQTAVRFYAGDNPILWPVEPQYLDGLKRAYPDIEFVDKRSVNFDWERKEVWQEDGKMFLPLRWADQILKLPYTECMKSKYTILGLHWWKWQEKAMWHRDSAKEEELFNRFGLEDGVEYTLINRFFGNVSQLQADIEMPIGRVVIMYSIPGYSLFDWAKVIENATHIHAASSSIIYLTEMLKLKAREVHLYARKPVEPHFDNVSYLLRSHEYVLHV